jgi:hypothetical protein
MVGRDGTPSSMRRRRTGTDNEVDPLPDKAGALWPLEIRSGQTVAGDMLRELLKHL